MPLHLHTVTIPHPVITLTRNLLLDPHGGELIFVLNSFPKVTPCLSSERSVPEWESHVDAEGELFYVEFGSNTIPGPVQAAEGAEVGETQEISKQKSKSELPFLVLVSFIQHVVVEIQAV
jgi:hypothetical protein